MKKSIIFNVVVCIMTMICMNCSAASQESLNAANELNALGLFSGVGTNADGTTNYDLDRAPTRNEAVTMLVRLLGKETEAKNGNWDIPFNDVADWAKPYVGYAYNNGLASGTSSTTFEGDNTVSATQYLTFVLRALNYSSETDFKWDKAWILSDKIGLTDGRYTEANSSKFLRGDVAIISNSALKTSVNKEGLLLSQKINGEQKEANVLYEDKWVKIKYAGFTSKPSYDIYSQKDCVNFDLEFSITNKGDEFTDGISYPKIMVVNKTISLNGHMPFMYLEDGMSNLCVISANQTRTLTVSGTSYSPSDLANGLKDLGAQFVIHHGKHDKEDFSTDIKNGVWYNTSYETLGEFYRSGTTDAVIGKINIMGGSINTTVPEVIDTIYSPVLKYSDDKINIYLCSTGHGVYYQNKTNKLINLKLESLYINGILSDWANYGMGVTELDILPYSTISSGIMSDAKNIIDADMNFTVITNDSCYPISITK